MRFKFPVCFQSPSPLCPIPNSFILIFNNYVVHIVQGALSQLVIYPPASCMSFIDRLSSKQQSLNLLALGLLGHAGVGLLITLIFII